VSDKPEEPITLGEAAYRRLRTDIVACRLEPGVRLTVEQLVAATGFGTSPLRDALMRLDQEGLVRTLPRKGYQVTTLTPKSVDDLLDLWGIVGPEVVRRGVARVRPEQKRLVATSLEEIERVGLTAPGASTAEQLIELLDRIFALLAEASGNDYLVTLIRRLSSDLARVWMVIMTDESTDVAMTAVDLLVRQILVEKDPDVAADMSRTYLKHLREQVRTAVSRWPSVANSQILPLGRRPHPGGLTL
jgi:DNA-binding GntR family transcriptional regulator